MSVYGVNYVGNSRIKNVLRKSRLLINIIVIIHTVHGGFAHHSQWAAGSDGQFEACLSSKK